MLQYALRRRGVAYEVAQAMSFEVHEAIVNYLFFELKKEPMEGFSQVTLQQVAAADRELHVRLAEATRAGFRVGPAGELPLDLHVKEIALATRCDSVLVSNYSATRYAANASCIR